MAEHRVVICTVAWGGWYPRGVARMIQEFHEVSPGFEIQAWVNIKPPFTPTMTRGGRDYTGYAAKAQALRHAFNTGADVALLLDASFYPIRSIHPLLDYIAQTGYYLCRNGNVVGEWSSDDCLKEMATDRDAAMKIPEASSYAVGISRHHAWAMELMRAWSVWSMNAVVICGRHSAPHTNGHNAGFVSVDKRVLGHRHDQACLSILAHQMGLTELVARPRFSSYAGSETEETVLVNAGMSE